MAVGFTIVFTVIGALAGIAGQRLESSGLLEHWSRPLGILAGTGILLLGINVAVNSDASGACRLPLLASRSRSSGRLDTLKMMFMGSAFAVGCSTCFGGVSAVVMIFFSVILITDNFHIPSNLLYRLYLGL